MSLRGQARVRRLGLALTLGVAGLLAAGSVSASAATSSVDCSTSGTFTITDNVVTGQTACVGAVTIPNTVTEIGTSAFANATSVTGVSFTAPSSLMSIGDRAFFRASGVASIAIPAGVVSIGQYAFYDANSLVSASFVPPSRLASIGNSAFAGANGLTTITIPGSVTSIGSRAFWYHTMPSVYFEGAAAPTIGSDAFADGPTGATAYRFAGATGFGPVGSPPLWNGLVIADYVSALAAPPAPVAAPVGGAQSAQVTVNAASVGPTASSYLVTASPGGATCEVSGTSGSCTIGSLTPGTAYTFSAVARASGPSLVSVASAASGSVVVPSWCLSTYAGVVHGPGTCTGAIVVPKTITRFNDQAFQGAAGLTSVSFEEPSLVDGLGYRLFAGSSLTSIELPSSLVAIGPMVFDGVSNLTSITIPGSVTFIDYDAFRNASGLSSVYFGGPLAPTVGSGAFGGVAAGATAFRFAGAVGFDTAGAPPMWNGLLVADYVTALAAPPVPVVVWGAESALVSVGAASVGPLASSYLVTASPGGASCVVTGVSGSCTVGGLAAGTPYAFSAVGRSSSPSLVSVPSPSSVAAVASSCLEISSNVVTGIGTCGGAVVIPNTVTSIGDSAFQGATGVTSVVFESPSSVTSIGAYAFSGASGLGSITIPSSVRTIGDLAFFMASSLTTVALSNGLEVIGPRAFYGTGLTSVAIPSTVTSIGGRAFLAPQLVSVTVAADNAAYSSDAEGVLFDKAKATLIQYPQQRVGTSYTVPSSVETIGFSAFKSAARLVTVSFASPSALKTIGPSAFESATSLASIVLPSTLETIGDSAFESTSLVSITLPSGFGSIGEAAFYRVATLASVYFEGAAAPLVAADAFGLGHSGATAYRFAGATGFTTAGAPPMWNGLLVADYVTALAPPPAPTAVAGVESATVTVAAALIGPSASSHRVTAAPGGATCVASGASGSCTVAGLTAGSSYTFTAVARSTSPELLSAPSAVSNAVVPSGPGAEPLPPAAVPAATSGATPAAAAAPPLSRVGQPEQTAGGLSATIVATGPGQVRMRVVANGARTWRAAPLAVCSASKRVTKAGRVTLTCSYSKAVRARLAKAPLKATLTLTFAPVSGAVSTSSSVVTIKRIRIATPKPVVSPGALPSRVTG